MTMPAMIPIPMPIIAIIRINHATRDHQHQQGQSNLTHHRRYLVHMTPR
jgi:hypothetical protein